jgi:hypothetical protein
MPISELPNKSPFMAQMAKKKHGFAILTLRRRRDQRGLCFGQRADGRALPPPDRASFPCAKPALVTDGIRRNSLHTRRLPSAERSVTLHFGSDSLRSSTPSFHFPLPDPQTEAVSCKSEVLGWTVFVRPL